MNFRRMILWSNENPRKLFLLDGAGAILSVFLLGFVLVKLEGFFGIPKNTLYFLTVWPLLFAIYDLYCYCTFNKNWNRYLTVIAIFNLMYCCLSIGLALYHALQITIFGWIYIVVEVMIVIAIAILELKVSKTPKMNI